METWHALFPYLFLLFSAAVNEGYAVDFYCQKFSYNNGDGLATQIGFLKLDLWTRTIRAIYQAKYNIPTSITTSTISVQHAMTTNCHIMIKAF